MRIKEEESRTEEVRQQKCKESWLKQDGMTRMWLAVSVGYAAGNLRPRTQ